jgi:predicted outer membrane repeat protein
MCTSRRIKNAKVIFVNRWRTTMKNLIYIMFIISLTVSAKDFKVNNVEEFQEALIAATKYKYPSRIIVAPGHYEMSDGTLLYAPGSGGEFGDYNPGLTIQAGSPSTTFLDGGGWVTPMTIELPARSDPGPILIQGLTFTNGKGENGGGLSIIKGYDVIITNSRFIGNIAENNGGGLYAGYSSKLIDNQFINNEPLAKR